MGSEMVRNINGMKPDALQRHRPKKSYRALLLLAAGVTAFAVFRIPIARQNVNRGDAFLAANMLGRAGRQYSKALLLYPAYTGAFNRLAFTYERMGDLDEAIRTFERSFEKDPRNDIGYVELGRIYLLQKKESARAIGLFTKSLEINPRNREAYVWLVVFYKGSGERGRALSLCREMRDKFPGDAWAESRVKELERN